MTNMKRRMLLSLGTGAVLLACGASRADDKAEAGGDKAGFVLITPEQFEQEQRAQATRGLEVPASRKRGLFPLIRVIAPEAGAADLASPLRIEIHFETSRDAHIVPATFRVLYGLMKFDLTETLKRSATWNGQGIVVERAMVPQGTHRLLVQIADDRGRVNEQELRLKVAA